MNAPRSATSLRIVNARAADATAEHARFSVGIRDGVITHAGKTPPRGDWDETIDADGLLLLPAWHELSARLREPGETRKADIASELRAAAFGGFAAVCIPPDTQPVIDRPAVVDWIRTRTAATQLPVRVHLLGAASVGLEGRQLAEMGALGAAGCVGVAQPDGTPEDPRLMRRMLQYAASFGLTLHITPLDRSLMADGCAHDGALATRMGLPPIPSAAETAALAQWLALVEDTGARVHFGRLSTARGAAMIADARAAGLPVTADVALANLLLCDDAIRGYDTRAHLLPPLRAAADRDALRQALARGDIDAVCCDHQPHETDAKNEPFALSAPGASGLDSAWPLALSLLTEGVLDATTLARATAAAPAGILGQAAPELRKGQPAALVLLEPAQPGVVQTQRFLSRGRNTPFEDCPVPGGIILAALGSRLFEAAVDASSRRR